MKIYLVGGAVRDMIMGQAPKDKDYVVVGSTVMEMLELGYKYANNQNSKNIFPIFLHATTKEEYALARKEVKTSLGKGGFEINSSKETTLEEDLFRRDLTINSIAIDEATGEVFDPHNGVEDIRNKVLKAVSEHFKEDPSRLIRVAIFKARYEGFIVDEQTIQYCKDMVKNGEVATISPSSLRGHLVKIFGTSRPSVAFDFLREVGALKVLFPEIDKLYGIPQNPKYHPEGCVYTHVMMVLDNAKKLTMDLNQDTFGILFAALCHDLGKGVTPTDILPAHHNHEENGVELVEKLCEKLQIGSSDKKLAVLVCRQHLSVHRSIELKASRLLQLITDCNGMRDKKLFNEILLVCHADDLGKEKVQYSQKEYLLNAIEVLKGLRFEGRSPAQIHEDKVNALKTYKEEFNNKETRNG